MLSREVLYELSEKLLRYDFADYFNHDDNHTLYRRLRNDGIINEKSEIIPNIAKNYILHEYIDTSEDTYYEDI